MSAGDEHDEVQDTAPAAPLDDRATLIDASAPARAAAEAMRVGAASPDAPIGSPDPVTPPGPEHVSLEETALRAKEAQKAQHAAVHARRANIRKYRGRAPRRPAR
jgi:hypothetical protein